MRKNTLTDKNHFLSAPIKTIYFLALISFFGSVVLSSSSFLKYAHAQSSTQFLGNKESSPQSPSRGGENRPAARATASATLSTSSEENPYNKLLKILEACNSGAGLCEDGLIHQIEEKIFEAQYLKGLITLTQYCKEMAINLDKQVNLIEKWNPDYMLKGELYLKQIRLDKLCKEKK